MPRTRPTRKFRRHIFNTLTVFIVQEFVGMTDDAKLKMNAQDLNSFVRFASEGVIKSVSAGQLAGPVAVPGNEHFGGSKSLFIGKCRRQVCVGDLNAEPRSLNLTTNFVRRLCDSIHFPSC